MREARESLRLDPFRRFARMFAIQCLLQAGDRDRAGVEFAALLELYPGQRESLEQWYAEQRRALPP